MAYINIDINAFQCSSPIINSVVYSGTPYLFILDWSSEGDYYTTIDSTTHMTLDIDIIEISSGQTVFTGVISPSVIFNTADYPINILDYYSNFGNKYSVTFNLTLINNIGCNNVTSYTVPDGTYP